MEINNYFNEVWKPIRGYLGLYEISNYGRVKSLANSKSRKTKYLQLKNKDGYLFANLHSNGSRKWFAVHRLVAIAFLPNPFNLPVVNHKDCRRNNNFVWVNEDGTVNYEKSNLEWCTQKYNCNYNKKYNGGNSRIILQFSMSGDLINKWNSMAEATRENNKSFVSNHKNHEILASAISACCRGIRKTHAGFIWRYAD